jgi:pimeloyl-ACP methyl ester carboxylesterase
MAERLVASLQGPAGAPVVVLGNSLGTTRELWEPQVGALGGRFRLLRYEHRGHGGSRPRPARMLSPTWPPTCSSCSTTSG